MPFALEEELCEILSEKLDARALRRKRPHTTLQLRERSVGGTIPDYIFVSAAQKVKHGPQPPSGCTNLESWIIATLIGSPLHGEALAERLFTRLERLIPSLLSLRRFGVIRELDSGEFAITRSALPRGTHVIAIEAKLRRWRQAVQQAAAYLRFANQSYVALPTSVIEKNPRVIDECAQKRLGLIGVDREAVTVIRLAPIIHTRSPEWVWLVSRAVGVGCSSPRLVASQTLLRR